MSLLLKLLTYLTAAVIIGLISAWYMITVGSALTVQTAGPWSIWFAAGNPEADPYTRAHFARSGRLPITSTSARYYVARRDSTGDTLDADCEYQITGSKIPGSWWSLAAYDSSGDIMPNKAKRYAFNKQNLSVNDDGSYQIKLSPFARPGNWLPMSGGSRVQLILRIYRGDAIDNLLSRENASEILPTIKRVSC
ncbi:MAG: DUF1214 domain-containing protein [Methyloligellaceae bacterium]